MTVKDVSRMQKFNTARRTGARMAKFQAEAEAKRNVSPRSPVGRRRS